MNHRTLTMTNLLNLTHTTRLSVPSSTSPHCRPDTTVPHRLRYIRPELHDATATDAKGRNALHRARDHPAGFRLATLVTDLGIYRPVPHYSRSDYAAGAYRHRPLCAADRNSGFGWAVFTARSRPGRSCRSRRAHCRGDLLQPLAPSISAIATRLRDRSAPRSVELWGRSVVAGATEPPTVPGIGFELKKRGLRDAFEALLVMSRPSVSEVQ